MPPLPKKKHTNARTKWRRKLYSLSAPTTVECPECGAEGLSHRACRECGAYAGRKVKISGLSTEETES